MRSTAGLHSRVVGSRGSAWSFFFVKLAQLLYEGHLESKERFAIKKYLLIIGNKKNMQVLPHTFTYFST
jgi:hypothetical protein